METGIDVDIARWILEFLVRQPLEDRTLNTLIEILPLTDDNLSLKKSLLLRKLESEIAAGIPSEKMLDLLQMIEEIDFRCNVTGHSGFLKTAYCHLAVACTVKLLDDEVEYLRAVKRIWRGRVSKMMEAKGKGSVGLVSEELLVWAADIERAVLDDGQIVKLREKSGGIDAVAAVTEYVKEEKKNMGPSFLELVAEATRTDDSLRQKFGLPSLGRDDAGASSPPPAPVVPQSGNGEMTKGAVLSRRKYGVSKRTSRGAKIAVADAPVTQKYNLLSSPEVDAAQKALVASSTELRSVVNDPLPEALDLASTVVSGAARKNTNEMPVEQANGGDGTHAEDAPGSSKDTNDVEHADGGDCTHAEDAPGSSKDTNDVEHADGGDGTHADDAPGPSKDSTEVPTEQKHDEDGTHAEGSRPAQSNGADTAKYASKRRRDAPGRSLMERNSTAQTLEWEDDQISYGKRVCLSSPKTRRVSPLNIHVDKPQRRKPRKWSLFEEETLRTGVDTYGPGNWKVILKSYRDSFDDRTEVDLKDKWRNMNK